MRAKECAAWRKAGTVRAPVSLRAAAAAAEAPVGMADNRIVYVGVVSDVAVWVYTLSANFRGNLGIYVVRLWSSSLSIFLSFFLKLTGACLAVDRDGPIILHYLSSRRVPEKSCIVYLVMVYKQRIVPIVRIVLLNS